MTVKELEEKTGLARANIRYYEQQGLLKPARRENGYREYSDEDLQTLQKIKLLRHLGLSIETIGAVQRGAQPLSKALQAREKELSREVAMLEREKTVCRELQQRQIAYDALEPKVYLAELEREEAAAGNLPFIPRPEKKDLIQSVYHPWRRYFARYFDMSLYSFLWEFVWIGIFHIGDAGVVTTLLNWLVLMLLMLLIEPLLLSRFGTTPGKALFGLHVSAVSGGKLTCGEAGRWTRGAIYSGQGLNIPFVNLWCGWKSYCRCRAGEAQPWEADINYTIRDTKIWRGIAFIALESLMFAALVVLLLHAVAPPCYGALSRADYIENVNHIAAQAEYGRRMDEDGNWTLPSAGDGILIWDDSPKAIQAIKTDESGCVAGVTLSLFTDRETWIGDLPVQMVIAYGALSARENGPVGLRYYAVMKAYRSADIDLSRSGSTQCGTIQIQWDVERQGFDVWENTWLSSTGNTAEESDYYTCTVTMTYTV